MSDALDILGQTKNLAVEESVYRNICSLIISEDLFDDIVEDPSDITMAQAIEEHAKPPHFSSRHPIVHRPFEEAEWNESVQYPFENWQETRFSDGKFGVWYGASDLETTIHETAYHWVKRTLVEEGQIPEGRYIERKIYTVQLDALVLDLRPLCKKYKKLIHPTDYSLTHQVGRTIHEQGHPGLITKSARCQGDVYSVFNPKVISNPKVNCWMRYSFKNDRIEISKPDGSKTTTIQLNGLMGTMFQF